MKISTKGRYALRLMLDLALNNTGEAVSLKDIARRQDISDKYLEQIISILNKAGYVRSIRGTGRLYVAPSSKGVHGGHDFKTDGRNTCTGQLCRG